MKREVASIGIVGLDEILDGGLPRNRFYLVQGNPGVGKTTLALQFLLAGATAGESCLYITLSETKEELLNVSASHGWSLDKITIFELSNMEKQLNAENQSTVFHPSEMELNSTTQMLLSQVEQLKPRRVVFDSLSEMRLLAQTPLRYRREMLSLKTYFANRDCTVLLLDDLTAESGDAQVQSIAHGVIMLQKIRSVYGAPRRQIEIVKLRGVKFHDGCHDYVIQKGGIEVFPRLIAAQHRTEFKKQTLSSGITELDELLGGGLDFGTTNIFMGPAGCGKSTLALNFVASAAKNNFSSAIFSFDENVGISLMRAKALGVDLPPAVSDGRVILQQVDPAELSPGELAFKIKRLVEKQGIRVLLIDSLNGYMNAMPGEQYLLLQLHEMLSYLGSAGVLTIMTLAQHGLIGHMQTPVDLTYLADAVLLLRFFESEGAINKAVSVIKKRSGNHEKLIRELILENGAITVGKPLVDFHGVLTGTPQKRAPSEVKGK